MASSNNVASSNRRIMQNRTLEDSYLWQKSNVIFPFEEESFQVSPLQAYMGPCFSSEVALDEFKDSFSNTKGVTDIMVSTTSLPIHPFFKSSRPFRTAPNPLKVDGYLAWLKKVKDAKSQTRHDLGIYDLIQLSKHPDELDATMIGASIFFWNKTTNTFHFPCGMMTPTLFDIAAITGLRPDGKLIHPL